MHVPPTPAARPLDLPAAEVEAWDSLDGPLAESWRLAKADQGKLWFTLVGRQGEPVVLISPLDTEPNRWLARPAGDAGKRAASQSGAAMYFRNPDAGVVKLMISSGIGTPEARRRLAATLDSLGYFRGLTVKV